MTPWAHLPNAAFIDEVLASVRTNPKKWGVAWDATRDAARGAAWVAAWDAARVAAWAAAWDAARVASRGSAWDAARNAIAALIAYDDAGQFMKLPADHLKCLYRIDPHPMFLLLQPAAIIFDPRTTP